MAHWGIAYASGPNYNYPWLIQDMPTRQRALAHAATQSTLALIDRVTPTEAALISALPTRYPQPEPVEDMSPWDRTFAEAIRAPRTPPRKP